MNTHDIEAVDFGAKYGGVDAAGATIEQKQVIEIIAEKCPQLHSLDRFSCAFTCPFARIVTFVCVKKMH